MPQHPQARAQENARLRVLIDVQLRPDQSGDAFEAALGDLPVITEANHVTGAFDYLLRADLADAASLDRLLRELKRRAGVAATNTPVILRTTLPLALTARQSAP